MYRSRKFQFLSTAATTIATPKRLSSRCKSLYERHGMDKTHAVHKLVRSTHESLAGRFREIISIHDPTACWYVEVGIINLGHGLDSNKKEGRNHSHNKHHQATKPTKPVNIITSATSTDSCSFFNLFPLREASNNGIVTKASDTSSYLAFSIGIPSIPSVSSLINCLVFWISAFCE